MIPRGFLVLLLASFQNCVISDYDCNGNIISSSVVNKIPGCIDEPFIHTYVTSLLSGSYNMTVLTESEARILVLMQVAHMAPQAISLFDKRVSSKLTKDKSLSLMKFSELSRAQSSVVIAMFMEFKNKHRGQEERDWYDLIVNQDWAGAINYLENVESSDEKQIMRHFSAVVELSLDDHQPCCPGRVYEGHCYFMGDRPLPLIESREYCDQKARSIISSMATLTSHDTEDSSIKFGDLAKVHNYKVLNVVQNLMGNDYTSWVGAFQCSHRKDKFVFKWTDEDNVEKNEKQNYWRTSSGNEYGNCAVYSDDLIEDHTCEGELPFVCELSMPVGSKADVEIEKKEYQEIRKKSRIDDALAPIISGCQTGENFATCDTPKNEHIHAMHTAGTAGTEQQKRKKRNAIAEIYSDYLWPFGVIPYVINPTGFNDDELKNISAALISISSRTCVRYVERTDEVIYVIIMRYNTGCWANIGRDLDGVTYVNLGLGCTYVGTIQHELLHVLGFIHEHARPDRDDHVIIHWENILDGMENNFYKYSTDFVQTMNHSYDPGSILHYGQYSLSKNKLPTMELRQGYGDIEIGQRFFMTANDVAEINNLYKCKVPVDGGWAYWGEWGACDQPCGGGLRIRSRKCSLPLPLYNGLECEGAAIDTQECNRDDCDHEYHWAGCWKYSLPGALHNLNGEGRLADIDPTSTEFKTLCAMESADHGSVFFAIKNNTCFAFDDAEEVAVILFQEPSANCDANGRGSFDSVDIYRNGNGSHQAYYGPWLDHSPCTVTCGGGIKTFIRECNNPPVREGFGDSDCEGDSQQNHVCNEELCPVNGGWGEWSLWADCSQSCGPGIKVRTRLCDNPPPANGGSKCENYFGASEETTVCNTGICPAVDGCPIVESPEKPEVFEHYSFSEPCVDGGYPGIVSELKPHDEDIEIMTGDDGSVTFSSGQKLIGEITGLQPCLLDPKTCTTGFGIELKINKYVDQPEDTSEESGRTMVIFSTGVNSDSNLQADEAKGITIFFAKDGELRATVKDEYRTYSVDLPAYLFAKDTKDKFHNIFVYWSKLSGLWIAYQGVWFSSDVRGMLHDHVFTKTGKYFCVGGPCFICNTRQYFSGYISSLTIFDHLYLDTDDPFTYSDFTCDFCHVDAECDMSSESCTCRTSYVGDGILYCSQVSAMEVPLPVPVGDPVYQWPSIFNVEYSDTGLPRFQNTEGDVESLYSKTLVRSSLTDNVLVFNGVGDYIDGGEASPCFRLPSECDQGFTVTFTLVYHGRGEHFNYIFSTGSFSWYHSTGMSLFVENGTATMQVQTENILYKTDFTMNIGVREKYMITWSSSQGLLVFVGSDYYPGVLVQSPGSPNHYGHLKIGQPSTRFGVYNGRFDMEDFKFWESAVELPLP